MGKIAKGVNKIIFTMLYGNYCYIIIENFPRKFSSCRKCVFFCFTLLSHCEIMFIGSPDFAWSKNGTDHVEYHICKMILVAKRSNQQAYFCHNIPNCIFKIFLFFLARRYYFSKQKFDKKKFENFV